MHITPLLICIILTTLCQTSCQEDFGRRNKKGHITTVNHSLSRRLLNPLALNPPQNSSKNRIIRKRKRIRPSRPSVDPIPVDQVFSGGLILDRRPKHTDEPPQPDIDEAMGRVNSTSDIKKMIVLNLPHLIEKQIKLLPKPLNTLYLSGSLMDLLKPPATAFGKLPSGERLVGLKKVTGEESVQVVNVTQPPALKLDHQQGTSPVLRSRVFKQGKDSMNSPYALLDPTAINPPIPPPRFKLRKKTTTSVTQGITPKDVTIPPNLSRQDLHLTSISTVDPTRRMKRRRKIQDTDEAKQDFVDPTTTTSTTTLRPSLASPRTKLASRTSTLRSVTVTQTGKHEFSNTTKGSWEEESDLHSFHKFHFEPLKRGPSHSTGVVSYPRRSGFSQSSKTKKPDLSEPSPDSITEPSPANTPSTRSTAFPSFSRRKKPVTTTSPKTTTDILSESQTTPSHNSRKKSSLALSQSSNTSPTPRKRVSASGARHLIPTTTKPTTESPQEHTTKNTSQNHSFHQYHRASVRRIRFRGTTTSVTSTKEEPVEATTAKQQDVQQINPPKDQTDSNIQKTTQISRGRSRQRVTVLSAARTEEATLLPDTQEESTGDIAYHAFHRYHTEPLKRRRYEQTTTYPPTPFYHDEIGQGK